jgi:hypothetical protein
VQPGPRVFGVRGFLSGKHRKSKVNAFPHVRDCKSSEEPPTSTEEVGAMRPQELHCGIPNFNLALIAWT